MLTSTIPISLLPEFTPREIAARMPCAWYEAGLNGMSFTDTGGTTAATAQSAVACQKDMMGYGYNATQSTAVNRPTLQISGDKSFLRHDGTDVLTVQGLPALSGGNFSTNGSIYWVTPSGMQTLHGQTISTSLSLSGANSDVYGWIVTPERLNSVYETRLESHFRRLAWLS